MAHSGVQIFSRATHIEKCLGCCLLGRAFWAVHRVIYVCMRNKLYTFSFAQMHIHKRLYIHTQVARKRIKKEPAARELWIQKCISQAQTDYLNLFKISQLHYIHNAHPNVDSRLRSTNCCFLLQISRWTKKRKDCRFSCIYNVLISAEICHFYHSWMMLNLHSGPCQIRLSVSQLSKEETLAFEFESADVWKSADSHYLNRDRPGERDTEANWHTRTMEIYDTSNQCV